MCPGGRCPGRGDRCRGCGQEGRSRWREAEVTGHIVLAFNLGGSGPLTFSL